MLDTLQTKAAGQRKERRKCFDATVRGQLCMDNISIGLEESNDSSISGSSEESLSVIIPVIAVEFPNFYFRFS